MEEWKKVYIHYEGSPEYTHIARITRRLTSEELAVEFTREYNEMYGQIVSLDPAMIELLNGRGLLPKSVNLIRHVKDGSDVFAVQRQIWSRTTGGSGAGDPIIIEQNSLILKEENNDNERERRLDPSGKMGESKKVYVHYEGSPEYTHIAWITRGFTVEQLASEFASVYNAKHGQMKSLDPATIQLLIGRRRISKSVNLIRFVRDRSDIFVELEIPSSSAGSVGDTIE